MPETSTLRSARPHDLLLLRARGRVTAKCSCGWVSTQAYRTVVGAHLAFGRHLAEVAGVNGQLNREDT